MGVRMEGNVEDGCVVYRTEKRAVPECLKELGYVGEISVKVVKTPGDGRTGYDVIAEVEFDRDRLRALGKDDLDVRPTIRHLYDLEDAVGTADVMINHAEEWDTPKYN